jgi:hypothetical protein
VAQKLRGHSGVEPLGGDAYLFRFDGRTPVVVAWQEGGERALDLTAHLPGGKAQVTRIVTETDSAGEAVRPPAEVVAARDVLLGDMPVFVEAAP